MEIRSDGWELRMLVHRKGTRETPRRVIGIDRKAQTLHIGESGATEVVPMADYEAS